MQSILEQVRTELAELKAFVQSIAPVNSALSKHPDASVRQYLTLRRQYDYAAFVVALYASFERYTEALIAEYARLISSFIQYKDLPPSLVKKHLVQSAEMLSRKRLGEGRYANLLPVNVAESLFKCLSGDDNYTLTSEAVIAHDTNLRYNDVSKLLGEVGVVDFWTRFPSVEIVYKWFVREEVGDAEEHEVPDRTPEIDSTIRTMFETRLNDLVERRNEVAHRGGGAEQLLGQAEMLSRIDFVETLTEAMFNLSSASYLKLRTQDPTYASNVAIVEGPYKLGSVIVIDPPGFTLSQGQALFIILANGDVKWGRIVNLMVDEVPIATIEPGSINGTVGVEVDFRCTQKSEVWVKHTLDCAVWGAAVVTH
ncbi:HEPN domain-containing protein [Pseudomonas sp. Pseusp11]|uniref:HEPN domain-containing protein n=1 Tax=Pseudomonas sp. Pseusp11 TaxID=3243003 RepID=UPI0039B6B558